MNIRVHKILRELTLVGSGAGIEGKVEVELSSYSRICVRWSTSDDSTAPPTSILCYPTNSERATRVNGNFPGLPAAPAAGFNAYASIGPDMQVPQVLPTHLTVGAIAPAGCRVDIRVSGDLIENVVQNPEPVFEANS